MGTLISYKRRSRRGCEKSRVNIIFTALLAVLILTKSGCQSESSDLNATYSGDVAALVAFHKAVSDPGGRLRSWRAGLDPCGSPTCSLGDDSNAPQGWHTSPVPRKYNSTGMPVCNYFGIACQNWRVERLVLSCNGVEAACAALQGSLPEEIGNLTELRVLDLQRNQLRSTIPEALGRLTNLEALRLASNRFYGYMSPKWVNMTALRVLDVRQNALTGVLPVAWGAFENLMVLHVDHNSLSGYLPASFGNLRDLRILALGNTAIVGPLPVSWANMTSLRALDVSSNCGICGNLPTFPPSVLAKLQVESQGSGLGWTCNKNACAQFPISILAQAVICMSIVGGLILLCLVRRVLFHYYPGLIILSPTAMLLHRQRGTAQAARNAQELAQQTSNMEAGCAAGNKRSSAVFLNPDSTYSYALKEEEPRSSEQNARNAQQPDNISTVVPQNAQIPVDGVPPLEEVSRTSSIPAQIIQMRGTGQG